MAKSVSKRASLSPWVAALRAISRVFRSPWAVLALLVLTLLLGFWGFSAIEGDDRSSTDNAYRTIQLIPLNASIPEEDTPEQLDVARFLAPLILPYAALVALFAAVGGRAGRMRMALFGRNHILIVGAGGRGTALARSLRDRYDVVLFELDESNGAAASLKRSGIPVLFGDARDEQSLRAAHPERAAAIVLLAGDDSVNLEALATVRKLIDPKRPVPTHVAIDGIMLWAELHRLPLEDADAQKRVEFFSVPDRSARLIAERAFGTEPAPETGRRILIHGAGEHVPRLVVQLLRSTVIGDDPRFRLEGAAPDAAIETLRAADPWVFDRAAEVATEVGEEAVTDSFVCGLPEADALSAGAGIERRISGDSPIYISVPDAGTGRTLIDVGLDMKRYVLIPTDSEVISAALLEASSFELIARGRHEEYVNGERDERGVLQPKPATRPWEDLDDVFREANYRYADGIHRMLDDLGARLVPLRSREAVPDRLPLSKLADEYLGIREHNRWWLDKCSDGFYWGPKKIEGTKAHPAMVPWDWLDDDDKDRDAESIRVLPKLLAECGYAVEMPPQAEVDARIERAGGLEAAKVFILPRPECGPPPDMEPPVHDET